MPKPGHWPGWSADARPLAMLERRHVFSKGSAIWNSEAALAKESSSLSPLQKEPIFKTSRLVSTDPVISLPCLAFPSFALSCLASSFLSSFLLYIISSFIVIYFLLLFIFILFYCIISSFIYIIYPFISFPFPFLFFPCLAATPLKLQWDAQPRLHCQPNEPAAAAGLEPEELGVSQSQSRLPGKASEAKAVLAGENVEGAALNESFPSLGGRRGGRAFRGWRWPTPSAIAFPISMSVATRPPRARGANPLSQRSLDSGVENSPKFL